MIKEIFGKPLLPQVIDDCSLILKNDDKIYIGKVYVFDANHFVQLIKLGDFWVHRVFKETRVVGYFSTPETHINASEHEIYTIIGKIGENENATNYRIEGVSFTKTCHSLSHSGSCNYIKFIAKKIIRDYN